MIEALRKQGYLVATGDEKAAQARND